MSTEASIEGQSVGITDVIVKETVGKVGEAMAGRVRTASETALVTLGLIGVIGLLTFFVWSMLNMSNQNQKDYNSQIVDLLKQGNLQQQAANQQAVASQLEIAKLAATVPQDHVRSETKIDAMKAGLDEMARRQDQTTEALRMITIAVDNNSEVMSRLLKNEAGPN